MFKILTFKKSRLNSEMIWKIWKKGKLNCEKIWKIWKKAKLKSEKIWKMRKKSMFWTQYCNTILSKENNFFCYLNIYTFQAEKKTNKKKIDAKLKYKTRKHEKKHKKNLLHPWVMVFNTTFNNISVISWHS
jgi:hypothetical protein